MNNPNTILLERGIAAVISDTTSDLEKEAIRIFNTRFQNRTGLPAQTVDTTNSAETSLTILTGTGNNKTLAGLIRDLGLKFPADDEGYLLHISILNNKNVAVVYGKDGRGVIYGLGKLLRIIDFDGLPSLPITTISSSPAGKQRGVYFATHFNNWYESAPIEDVEKYVEDLALWGVNAIWTWFDMNWYPSDFHKKPDSRGMQMISRIRRINETAHKLGMAAGLTGIANEGFSNQPPAELRADISAQRGGFYPNSQICPSKPGGLEMILRNRRKVLELIGPIDAFWYWPYDQGGCGCAECSDANGWGKTFLKIGPKVAQVVKEFNPNANFIVSTWLMNDNEMELAREQANKPDKWFDGLLVETRRASQPTAPADMPVSVFPEISMFDCFFLSYGCNGANPAPCKFSESASETARIGRGAVLYSEGVYEDINKIIWAAAMWDPDRTPEDIAEEYSQFYFGRANTDQGKELILGLENTWGPAKLAQAKPEKVESLYESAKSMAYSIPDADWCRWRWQALFDRAKLDYLMTKIGPDSNLLKAAKRLYDSAAYSDDDKSLRLELERIRYMIAERVLGIDSLFHAYTDYLEHFHLQSCVLIFRPDQYLGKTDFRSLLETCDRALYAQDNADMRKELISGIHKWFWFNGVEMDFMFL